MTPHRGRRGADGGGGPEAHRPGALWHGDQGGAQGYRGTRAKAVAPGGPRGDALRPGERGLAPAPMALRDDRRPQTAGLPWKTAPGTSPHRLLTTSGMAPPLAALAASEDHRAALEAERNAEPGGLPRHRRRQQRLAAQDARVLLTDGAPHLLAWTRSGMFRDAPVVEAGLDRRRTALWPIPGTVVGEEGPLVKRRLQTAHPLAKPLLACLARVLARLGTPGILRQC